MSDQPLYPPDLDDVLVELKQEIFSTLNCVQIGQIQSYNAAEQTAEIQLQVKVRVNPTTISDYPVLIDCPVFVLQGGGAYIDFPIGQGDYCIVLFNDRNIDIWWDSATVAAPENRRKHSLSDGIALVGINPVTATRTLDGSIVRILGPSGPGAEQFAARENDTTTSSILEDPEFWQWVTTISAAVNALSPGSVPNVPTSQAGRIDKGSGEVKIG